jgi:DNA-binding MarR family transcriptional regulator
LRAFRNIRKVPELDATRLPSRSEIDAWRAFLRAHAKVTRTLEAELLTGQRLSLGAYDVLAQLSEASDQRLRMAELAEAVLLSRSGVTRLVDRLERAGLVTRERVDGDGRGVVARLTTAGAIRLSTVSKTHLTGIAQHFVKLLNEQELAGLMVLCDRISEAQP